MVKAQQIHAFVSQVADEFHPERVILFGSYAYGKPTPDSDVDLLVVMPHSGPAALQAAQIRNRIHAGFPLDLLVRSPETVRQRLALGDHFIEDILSRGKTLYETGHPRVG